MIFGKKHEYRRNLILKRRNNNIFIEDYNFTLFLSSENRINYYPRGIAYRMSSIAKDYN